MDVQVRLYEGLLESKERFAIKKYLLIIGKKSSVYDCTVEDVE